MWWQYSRPQNMTKFNMLKISFPDISSHMQGVLDTNNIYHITTIYSISFNEHAKYSQHVYLGIINSILFSYYVKNTGTILRGGYIRFEPQFMNKFPIAEGLTRIAVKFFLENFRTKTTTNTSKIRQHTKLPSHSNQRLQRRHQAHRTQNQ